MMSYYLDRVSPQISRWTFQPGSLSGLSASFCHAERDVSCGIRSGSWPAGTVLDGAVVFDSGAKTDERPGLLGVTTYVAADNPAKNVARISPEVKFRSSRSLNPSFHGQVMEDGELREFLPLAAMAGDEMLASSDGQPIWILRGQGAGSVHLVGALPLPVREDEYLWEHFRAGCFIRVLPLIVFLRQLTREIDWQYARRQACFVLDDPSLYWPSYGYVDFRRLAEHARAHDYFASVATIPLDTLVAQSKGVGDLPRQCSAPFFVDAWQ